MCLLECILRRSKQQNYRKYEMFWFMYFYINLNYLAWIWLSINHVCVLIKFWRWKDTTDTDSVIFTVREMQDTWNKLNYCAFSSCWKISSGVAEECRLVIRKVTFFSATKSFNVRWKSVTQTGCQMSHTVCSLLLAFQYCSLLYRVQKDKFKLLFCLVFVSHHR